MKKGPPVHGYCSAQEREINTLLKNLGWSARKLAREMGLPPSSITRWKNGQVRITPKNVIALCEIALINGVRLPSAFVLLAGNEAEELRAVCQPLDNQ